MATKVKPIRLNITWTPQVWNVPTYVDADTFAWWAGWGWGSSFGRFLSLWDSTTWQPISFPEATPYTYLTWDYFIVETVSSATPPVNYRPTWSSYTGTASSVTESDEVEVWDTYVYDGTTWLLQSNHGKTVTFANIAWDPYDNANLDSALDAKQDVLVSWTNIKTVNNNSLVWSGNVSVWDMKYTDYNWTTLTWNNVTLALNSQITPTANFTINAPWTIKDWQEYILRITSGWTVYAITLGTNMSNPNNVDTTLTANSVDQFVFLAVWWQLELQPRDKDTTYTAWNWIAIDGTNKISTTFIYWESSTAAATVQKEVSIPSITELNVWQVIIVKPTVTSSVASSTLKLNSFPAYKMLYNAAEITTSTDSIVWAANIPSMFYLDEVSGTKYWRFLGHWLDSNTTYTINYLNDAWKYEAWTWTYAITRYSLVMMKADGTWEKITATSANYSTWTTKTVNTSWFVLNQIKYYNTTTTVAGGAFVWTNTFASQAASIRADYSFNCGTAPWWNVWDPIYIVWTIWVDGLFYLDTTARWTTTLPSTNDWKLYIRIWVALTTTDATASFLQDRPIFYYDNWIKEYTSSKQDKLTAWTWISISSNTVSNTWVTSVNWNTWAVTVSEFTPGNAWSTDQILTKTVSWYERAAAPASWIQNDTTWTTTTVSAIRAWTESEFALITPTSWVEYHVYPN